MSIAVDGGKAAQLAELIKGKWPDHSVRFEWNIDDGWHFAITKAHVDRYLFIIAPEVMEDWSPQQIIARLEAHSWLIVLNSSKGKSIPHFTNQGFTFNPWPNQ